MNLEPAYAYLVAAQTELASQRPGSDAVVNAAVRDTQSYIAAAKAALNKARQFTESTAEAVAA